MTDSSSPTPNFWVVQTAAAPTAPASIPDRTINTWLGAGGEGSYRPNQFYTGNTRAANEGNSHTFSARIRPALHDCVLAVVNDPMLPYDSASDLIRDAVLHRIMWLRHNANNEDLRDELERRLMLAETEAAAAQLEMLIAAEADLLERIPELMTDLTEKGAWKQAHHMLLAWKSLWDSNFETFHLGEDVLGEIEKWLDKVRPEYEAALRSEMELLSVRPVDIHDHN